LSPVFGEELVVFLSVVSSFISVSTLVSVSVSFLSLSGNILVSSLISSLAIVKSVDTSPFEYKNVNVCFPSASVFKYSFFSVTTVLPETTIIGALANYISTPNVNFQPMNANFGILPELGEKIKDKKLRYSKLAQRALEDLKKSNI